MRSTRFALLALVVVACSDSTRPSQPAQIVITPGGLSFDAISQTKTLRAIVRDADGGEIRGATVTWTGSDVISVTPLPDSSSAVRITAMTPGQGSVTASIGGISQRIDIQVRQAAARIEMSVSVAEASVGATVPTPVRVTVLDGLGTGVANVAVDLAPVLEGHVTPTTVTTGLDGTAQAQWTLGTTAGEQRLVGRAGTLVGLTFVIATPGPPAALLKVAGDAQAAWANMPVDVPPVVRVIDPHGNGIAGVDVTFSPSAGSVQFSARRTGIDGSASVGRWTMGPDAGSIQLTATVANVTPAVFAVEAAVGGTLVTIEPVAGDRQLGSEGMPLAVGPAVRLLDSGGIPQGNRRVDFRVRTGGGAVSEATATTTPDGIATVVWTIGSIAGPNELTVSVADGPATNNGVAFTATGCTGGSGSYVINVCFSTPVSASQRAAFVNAAARWGEMILADLPDLEVDLARPACGPSVAPIRSRIDDLVIFAAVEAIDGPGQILGSAGWCYTRAQGLPLLGAMRFDIADVGAMESAGRFDDVIMHEIGHVLGIGTLWIRSGFLQNPSTPGGQSLDTHFNGSNAVEGFDQIGGLAYTLGGKVPVENAMGAGSINSHWREAVLGNELMTPVINVGVNPLTVLSVQSLRDLGYEVDPTRADPQGQSDIHADRRAAPALPLVDDVDRGPRFSIDRGGRVRPLP